jgi:hypothetical protein
MIPDKYKLVHLIIIAQVMSNYITESIALKFLQGPFLNYVNNFRKKLSNIEKEYYDKVFTKEEQNTVDIYNTMDEFLKVVAQVPVYDMEDIICLIKAYQADEKSMQGIAKKILKYKDEK